MDDEKGPAADRPRHVAMIMDGNGRWARARGRTRTAGHRQGAEAARRVVHAAVTARIPYLTFFAFSSENWKRSDAEIDELMWLLRTFIQRELDVLAENGIRVRVIGDRQALPDDLRDMLARAEAQTRHNTALNLTVALNYGGRQDILQATRALARAAADGVLAADTLDTRRFARALSTADMPDPDLLVRTSGEKRLSNFLLWQCAYAELVFLDKLWPDMDADDVQALVDVYRQRNRRYGGIEPGTLIRR